MKTIRVTVAGASGRMGHMLIESIWNAGDCLLAFACNPEVLNRFCLVRESSSLERGIVEIGRR